MFFSPTLIDIDFSGKTLNIYSSDVSSPQQKIKSNLLLVKTSLIILPLLIEMLVTSSALEVTNISINKGNIISEVLTNNKLDFIFCCGDDTSDEYMFNVLPEKSISIKVGEKNTSAKYYVNSPTDIKSILKKFSSSEK